MEAVTHAVRWIGPRSDWVHPHATILTDWLRLNELGTVMNGKPAVACYKHNVDQLPFKAPVDVLFWTLQSQGINWPSLSRSEMLNSLRHRMQAQSLGCHTIDDDCGLRRGGVERGNAQWSAFKIWGMVIVIIMNETGTVSKETLVKPLTDWVKCMWSFPSA